MLALKYCAVCFVVVMLRPCPPASTSNVPRLEIYVALKLCYAVSCCAVLCRYMFQYGSRGAYCLGVIDSQWGGLLIGGVATRNVLVKVRISTRDCFVTG
jgi:hypothetical protein